VDEIPTPARESTRPPDPAAATATPDPASSATPAAPDGHATEPTGAGDAGTDGSRPATAPPDGRVAGDADIEVDRLAAAVYGTIVAGSVMAAGAGHLSTWDTAIAVVVTVIIYWLAESYAHLLAIRVVGVSDARRAHARHRLTSSWRLVTACVVPVAGMAVAALLGADDRDAVLVGLLCTTALLVVLGWWAARRSELRGFAVVASALGSGLLGLALIALKFALH
jgi:hypothetical protein